MNLVSLNQNMEALQLDSAYMPWSGVRYVSGSTLIAFAGDTSGRVLEINCPWGTQAMAVAMLNRIRGRDYQPFTASNTLIDPAAEPGDIALMPGATSPLVRMDITLDGLFSADVSAPGEEAINRDYPASSIPASMRSEIQQKVEQALKTLSDVSTEGTAVQNLYAQYGDFVDLVTDRLSTSKRIVRYLAGDTSDDNHVRISGEKVEWVAGICTGEERQAVNPYGQALYWKINPDPDGSGIVTGENGYPQITDAQGNAVQIYTTTIQTPWPVKVYVYNEQVKRKIAFELESLTGETPVYTPTDTLGAGNANGSNQAVIRKGANGLEVLYHSNAGRNVGVKGTTDGYLDLYGVRRVSQIDLSGWDSGSFSCQFEGDSAIYSNRITFDNQSRPVAITDGTGFTTAIRW